MNGLMIACGFLLAVVGQGGSGAEPGTPVWLLRIAVAAVVAGGAWALAKYVFKVPQRLRARARRKKEEHKDKVLVSCREFYGDNIDDRHGFDFKAVRVETAMVDGKLQAEETKPLEAVLNWIDGDGKALVVSGSGGLGKSRLLIEAAEEHKKLRFVQTRLREVGIPELAESLKAETGKGDVVVFDDVQEYAADFGVLLTAAVKAGARVIAATRYEGGLEQALQKAHVLPVEVRLGVMLNAADVVPAPKDVLEDIARVSAGNPALAVMAYMHYTRTKSLKGVKDEFHLMRSVFKELVEAGKEAGFPGTREFLAEMAVRGGLWEDHKPFPGHEQLAARLRKMGHIQVGGSTERRLYGVAPDQLRDHIIRAVYADTGILQPGFAKVVAAMPDEESVHVIRMLGIQFRETTDPGVKQAMKQACALVLDKFGKWTHGPSIGFKADITRKKHEYVIDVGYEAWQSFGDVAMVRKHLGDFCAGAESLDSTEHLNKAGLFYMNTGEPGLAIACYEAGQKIAGAEGNKYEQAVFLGNIGNVYILKGELDKALEYHMQAVKVFEEIGAKREQASVLGNIGLIWQGRGELDKALEYQEQALAMRRELGMKLEEAQALGNIGIIWQRKGELDKALEYQEQALAIDREIGDRGGEAADLANIGNVYVGMMEQGVSGSAGAGAGAGDAVSAGDTAGAGAGAGDTIRDSEDRMPVMSPPEDRMPVMSPSGSKAIPYFVQALGMFIEMGIADGPRQCLLGLRDCYRAMVGTAESPSPQPSPARGEGEETAQGEGEEAARGEGDRAAQGEGAAARFIAVCVKAGMSEDDAEKLVVKFEEMLAQEAEQSDTSGE